MMINYSEWHAERTPQGKKVNSVEETSSLSDKIDVIMSMLVNGRSYVDPNNVPLASLAKTSPIRKNDKHQKAKVLYLYKCKLDY